MCRSIAVLLFCFPLLALAQQRLEGPVDYPQLGISFTVPADWIATESEGFVYFGSEKIAGLIVMNIHELEQIDALKASLETGFTEDVIELFPAGTARAIRSDAVSIEYTGKIENEPATGLGLGLLNPHGNGVSIVAFALEKADPEPTRSAAMALMESVRFRKIEYSGPSIEHWKRHLTNTRLTRIENYSSPAATEGAIGGGYSSETQIDLCEGQFTMKGSSSVNAGNPDVSGSSAGRIDAEGKWDVTASPDGSPLLQLDHENGHRSEFKLDEQEGKVFLNGERWFRTWEGDHAPDCR